MEQFKYAKALNSFVKRKREAGISIGFVPTMGALHEGHLSLVRQAKQENDIVICSIFVNPTQFNNKNDLINYPKTIDNDLELLKSVDCDCVFIPSVDEMYPDKQVSKHYDFSGIENEMEGKHRPGHFDGVGTIVSKLLEITLPHKAYFGEKDYQQLQIVKKLASILNLDSEIVGCPIARNKSGLALSSRNKRLTKDQLHEASFIYSQLNLIKRLKKEHSPDEVMQIISNNFSSNPAFDLEYITIADENTLKTIRNWNSGNNVRAFVAAFMGDIRLIDNMAL